MAIKSETNVANLASDVDKEFEIGPDFLLPSKSSEKYKREFELFDMWRKKRGVDGVNEELILDYFHSFSNTVKASTLWSKYSMLKATININENVNIGQFRKIGTYLQAQARGYQPVSSKTFEREDIERFLTEAPDIKYLMMKVVLLLGICGACHSDELTYLTIDDIQDKESYLYITLANRRKNKPRSFIITNEGFSVNVLEIYRAYIKLRPNAIHRRLFLSYRHGKCTIQPVGIHTIGTMPRCIATYLKLPEPECYTGHCFRRTSGKLSVNRNASFIHFKVTNQVKSIQVSNNIVEDIKTYERRFKVSNPENRETTTNVSNKMNVDMSPIVNNKSNHANENRKSDVTHVKLEVCDQIIPKRCDICLKYVCVRNLYEMDKDDIKLISKLKTCIPEVEWQVDHLICSQCSEQLRNAYNFRQLCINSFLSKKSQKVAVVEDRPIKTEIDIEEAHLLEVPTEPEFLCSYCERCFYLESNLTHHLLVEHSDDPLCEKRSKKVGKINLETGKIEFDGNKTAVKRQICDASFPTPPLLSRHSPSVHSNTTEWKRLKSSNHTNKEFVCQTKHIEKSVRQVENIEQSAENKCQFNETEERTESLPSVNVKVECDSCGLSFQTQDLLTEHIGREHLPETDYKCNLCHVKCEALHSLNVHNCLLNTIGKKVFISATPSEL